MWWAAEDRAISRAHWALQIQGADLLATDEPFAAIILATADREKVDKRSRSKWSRCCDMQQSTRQMLNPLPRSSGARAASTSVLSDLLAVWGEAVEPDVELYQAWMRRSEAGCFIRIRHNQSGNHLDGGKN